MREKETGKVQIVMSTGPVPVTARTRRSSSLNLDTRAITGHMWVERPRGPRVPKNKCRTIQGAQRMRL
ncbi:hypothetical protein KM043_008713 [Ampulex compressa]|nr:hypothetical protein KM043_008713 [Ampulex compressa]